MKVGLNVIKKTGGGVDDKKTENTLRLSNLRKRLEVNPLSLEAQVDLFEKNRLLKLENENLLSKLDKCLHGFDVLPDDDDDNNVVLPPDMMKGGGGDNNNFF